jgi:hypothetical protein
MVIAESRIAFCCTCDKTNAYYSSEVTDLTGISPGCSTSSSTCCNGRACAFVADVKWTSGGLESPRENMEGWKSIYKERETICGMEVGKDY